MIWIGVLNASTGWLNYGLEAIGIAEPGLAQQRRRWVHPALALMGLWGIGNMMLIFLAGLQGVPTELYDAAKVDGAGPWASFRHITLPMISPVLFYNLVISLIGTFQYFTQAYIISNGRGDPDDATLFFNLNLYREAFVFFDMGYASALAWLLFVDRPGPDRRSCSGLARQLGLRGRRRAMTRDRAPAPTDRLSASSPLGRHMRRFTAVSGVTLLAIAVASAFLMPLAVHDLDGVQGADPAHDARGAALPGGARDVPLRRARTYQVYDVPMPDGATRRWRSSRRIARTASSSTRPTPTPDRSRGSGAGGRSSSTGRFDLTFDNFGDRLGRRSRSRGCSSTRS